MSLNRRWLWFAGVIGLLSIVAFLILRERYYFFPPATTFDGFSESLTETVVVPTLDTPFPANKSAVWCSSFQLAWNSLKKDVAKGPIHLKKAETIANRLNNAKQSDGDLETDDFYAAAGIVKDGIVATIQSNMERQFPGLVPDLPGDLPPEGVVAYGYLTARVNFEIQFFDNDKPLVFFDAAGRQASVKSFGIRKKDDYAYKQLRQQVQILHRANKEFIVDPCQFSQPYQIILAAITRSSTLAETVAESDRKIKETATDNYGSRMHPRDSLLIPEMHWRITHNFKELEGVDKRFLNPTMDGLFLDKAIQSIHFRLDRSGAELSSESKIFVKPEDSHYQFDRPFLIMMKKRSAEHPFFVMWIDNAELLNKSGAPKQAKLME